MAKRDSLPERLGRSTAIQVCWWLSILLTALTGLVMGYFPVWFQIEGGPDRGDYLMAVGGYGTGAIALFAAVIGVLGLRGPRSAAWTAGGLALVLTALTISSAFTAVGMPVGMFDDARNLAEGAVTVAFLPWTWVLVIAGISGGCYLRAAKRQRRGARPAQPEAGLPFPDL